MIGCRGYSANLICENADFKDAIIDDADLSKYLDDNNAKNIPSAVKGKEELKMKLKEKGLEKQLIEVLLNISSLT